jgi:hypothetical protein
MKIGNDRGCAMGQKGACICLGEKVEPFEMQVAVNKARCQVQSGEIYYLSCRHGPKRKDLAVLDGKIPFPDGLSKGIDYRSILEQNIGGVWVNKKLPFLW